MKSAVQAMLAASVLLLALSLVGCGSGGPEPPPQPLKITTASLPNGAAWVAYSQTINATGGVEPFTWTVKSGALPHNLALSDNATNIATISGTPDMAVQALAFTIEVTDSGGHSAVQSSTVSILLEQDTLVVSPTSLSFGTQLNGVSSAAQSFTLANNGSSTLAIVNVSTGEPDFAAVNSCGGSIAAGTSCAISVTFTPTALGPRSSALVISDNSVGSPHSYSLLSIA